MDESQSFTMLVTPTVIAPTTTDISVGQLQALGIKGIIFDLDNTLMAPHSGILSQEVAVWLDELRQAGFKLICVSNNKRQTYCQMAEQLLGMPVLHYARKPSPVKLLEALELLALCPLEVAVMGDRPLTDIWGGERIGAQTILVAPLIKDLEPFYIKGLRWLEWRFVNRQES